MYKTKDLPWNSALLQRVENGRVLNRGDEYFVCGRTILCPPCADHYKGKNLRGPFVSTMPLLCGNLLVPQKD